MTLLKTLASVGFLAVAAASGAQAETTLKLATVVPEKTPWGDQINRLAAAISEESDGRLKVEPYFNSQLGTENDTLSQLARGRIEMGVFTLSAGAQQAPEVGLMQLYGYFDSNEQRACVQENHLTEELRKRLGEKGVYFGAWAEVGNGYLMSDREITSVEDLKGLKIGISVNKINTAYWQTLGANPVPLSPGEAASAASTGLIDVYPTVYTFAVPSGFNKVYPIVNEYNYANGPGMFAMSQRVFDRLSAEDQEAVKRAYARLSLPVLMDEVFAFEDALREMHVQSGGKVVTLTDEQVAGFREPLPPFWAQMTAEYGEDGAAIFKLMEDAKAACGA